MLNIRKKKGIVVNGGNSDKMHFLLVAQLFLPNCSHISAVEPLCNSCSGYGRVQMFVIL